MIVESLSVVIVQTWVINMNNLPTTPSNNYNSNLDDQGISVTAKLGVSQKSLSKIIKRSIVALGICISFWGGSEFANKQNQAQTSKQSQAQVTNCNVEQTTTSVIPSKTVPLKPFARKDKEEHDESVSENFLVK
jgi:hypothetical protein